MEYELKLFSPDSIVMKRLETDASDYINSFTKEERDEMYQSYYDDFLMNENKTGDFRTVEKILESSGRHGRSGRNITERHRAVTPVSIVVEEMTGEFNDLQKRQFRTIKHNGIESVNISRIPEFWIQPVAAYIPDKSVNLDIIDSKMEGYGYVRTRLTEVRDEDRRQWYFAVYNPNPEYMPDVRSQIRNYRLLHFSHEKNHDSIMETGLVSSTGGRTYMYPDKRVFFYVYPLKRGEYSDSFRKMMGGIARKEIKADRDFSGIFNCYELDLDSVPENIRILYDPNAEDCIYLNAHIEPEWFKYKEDMWEEF